MNITPVLSLLLAVAVAVPARAAYSPLERAKTVTSIAVEAATRRLINLSEMPVEFAGVTLVMNYGGGIVGMPKDKAQLVIQIEAERKYWIATRAVLSAERERKGAVAAMDFGSVERVISDARESVQLASLIMAAGYIVEDLDTDLALALSLPEAGGVGGSGQALIDRKVEAASKLSRLRQ